MQKIFTSTIISITALCLIASNPALASTHYSTGSFPNDSLSSRADITGNGSFTFFTPASGSIYTVLYESYNTNDKDNNANIMIQCGTTKTLTVNSFALVPQIERFKMAKCQNSLTATIANTTGSPDTTVQVIYTKYNTASESFGYTQPLLTQGLASSSFATYASMTAGDILTILLLGILVLLNLFGVFRRHV